VIAYKFLAAGGVGPFSRYPWPLPRPGAPGAWVAGAGGATVCHDAVHACRATDLPWWLQDELWEAELGGAVTPGRHKVMAPRARLLRRVDGWEAACAQRFADACAGRARDHAVTALDRAGASEPARALAACATPREIRAAVVAAYIAAHAAARVDGDGAMAAERAWQSDWLRTELRLDA